MKKFLLVGIVVTTFVFFNIIYYSSKVTKLSTENSELTSSLTNDKIKMEIYNYIKMFDRNIIESLQVCDNEPNKLNNEQMVDIAVKYIISNQNEFNDKIEYFEDEYKYEKDGTIYYSRGYVDKSFLNEIIIKLFATSDVDVENSIYFDPKRNLVPLIVIYGGVSPYKEEEFLDFEELDYYNYALTVKYYISDTHSFQVKYLIERNEFNKYGKYSLIGMTIN